MTSDHLAPIIDDLARRQHGVVTREDLQRAGVGDTTTDLALRRRQLVAVHPGVFLVGGMELAWPSNAYADYRYLQRQIRRKRKPGAPMPVVALTGVADLALRGIGDLYPPEPALLVTNPPSRSRKVFHFHREDLRHDRVEMVNGFVSTVLPWSLAEASDVLPTVVMENIIVELVRDGEVTVADLYRAAGELGWEISGRLRRLLDGLSADDLRTRSGRERRVLRAFAKRGVELPEVNVLLVLSGHRLEVDMFWRAFRLILEIDGPHHDLPGQRQKDRRRDALAGAAGIHVERATMHDVDHDLNGLVDRIVKLLDDRR